MVSSILFLAQGAVSNNALPSVLSQPATALTISISSILVLLIASRTIQKPHVGPKAPLGPLLPLFNDISLAGFIGSMSFGHIIGTLLSLTVFK